LGSRRCERWSERVTSAPWRRRSAATGSARRRRHRDVRRVPRAARGAPRGARAWHGWRSGAAGAARGHCASGEHRRGGRRAELSAGRQEQGDQAGEAGAQEGDGDGGGGRTEVEPPLEGQPPVVGSESEDSDVTRHTAYNKHDTGWAKGAPSEDQTLPHRPPGPLAAVGLLGGRPTISGVANCPGPILWPGPILGADGCPCYPPP
jgi:hypothetical protein